MANKKYKLDGNDYWEASGVYDIGQGDTQRSINDEVVTKLATIEEGAEVNQNAFSNVTVGGTTIAADSKTDTLTLTAGSNITLTPNATNDSVTIAANDTTYGNATQSAAGLMSAADKKKLDTLDSSDITDNSDVGGATVEASLTSLKGSLTSLEPLRPQQKHLIIMGDSYSINDEWTGWIEQFKGITNFDVVAESGVGGSGFIGAPDIPTVFQQLANLTVENPDIITDIVIMGGYNDASARYYYGATEANFKTVIDSFASYARGRFKNAKIHYGFIGVDEHNNGFQQELNITRLMLERRCGEAGIAFIPNAHCVLLNHRYIFQHASNTNAGSHPNSTGTLEIARFLDNYLSSGYSDVVYGDTIRGLNLYVKNGYVYTFPTEKVFDGTIPDGSVFPANTWADLVWLFTPATDVGYAGTVCAIWWGSHDPLTTIQFYLPLYDDDGFKDFALFRIMDKKLQMYTANGYTFNGAGYCKAFPFSAPLEPSFG